MPGLQLDQDIINGIEIKHNNDMLDIFYGFYYHTYSLEFTCGRRNKK